MKTDRERLMCVKARMQRSYTKPRVQLQKPLPKKLRQRKLIGIMPVSRRLRLRQHQKELRTLVRQWMQWSQELTEPARSSLSDVASDAA